LDIDEMDQEMSEINAIEITGLTHRFGERTALNDLSYSVRRGEIFALLGPNGAGKTTTIRLLNGLYSPSARSIRVLGFDPQTQGQEVRCRTGVLTETNALYERLSARQHLHFFGTLSGMPGAELRSRIEEMLTFFGLQSRADEKVGTFSKGMKQRLALARAVLSRPQILFLDEPTSSLDPESAQQVHELIRSVGQQDGHTVFLCTHHLDEAQKLADRVAILNAGNLLALGTLEELARQFNPGLWVNIDLAQPLSAPLALGDFRGVVQVKQDEQHLEVQVESEKVFPALAAELVRQQVQLLSFQPNKVTLEQIYFQLQENAREGKK